MKRKRNLLTFIILILICFIGIGYAYLSSSLTINGTAEVAATVWDVHFENIKVTSGSVTPTVEPTLIGGSTSTSFTVELGTPGEFYEFTIDVVNKGTIDAMINTIVLGSLTTDQEKYLNYTVTYSDGMTINKKDLLEKTTGSETIKVRVEFKSDIVASDLPSSDISISLKPSLGFVQNDGGNIVKHINLTDADSDGVADVGEIVSIGSERFYVISNDGENIKAFAEWNLLVGNQYDGSTLTALTNSTGLQDSSAIGNHYKSGTSTIEYPSIGTVSFSLDPSYWDDSFGVTIDLNNSNNIVYPYLVAYKDILTLFGAKISDISLISVSELNSLGCDINFNTCLDAPSWVYNTSYWTKTAYNFNTVEQVYSFGQFCGSHYLYNNFFGIRPVITFKNSDLGLN